MLAFVPSILVAVIGSVYDECGFLVAHEGNHNLGGHKWQLLMDMRDSSKSCSSYERVSLKLYEDLTALEKW
jgi:hypothetical protein